LTAWQALVDVAKLQPGQTVLIHGGSGGVGSFAIQNRQSARGTRHRDRVDSKPGSS